MKKISIEILDDFYAPKDKHSFVCSSSAYRTSFVVFSVLVVALFVVLIVGGLIYYEPGSLLLISWFSVGLLVSLFISGWMYKKMNAMPNVLFAVVAGGLVFPLGKFWAWQSEFALVPMGSIREVAIGSEESGWEVFFC